MPVPPKQLKQEDTDYDELMDDDDEDEVDGEYQDIDEDTGFYIPGPLNRPVTSPMSCHDMYTQIQEGLISLEADYQRDVVWNDAKQSGLIDSVYRDYFVPPVLFAVHDIDGEKVKVCIDGKQRLTSIQRFMDGHIPFKVDGKSWYYCRKGTRATGKLIPEGFKKQFAAKQLLCVEFHGLSDAIERDIFQRVQLGMALNEAEKQKAISSPTVTWMRELVARYFEGDDGITQHLPVNTKRSKDFQCFAQYVYMANALPNFDMPLAAKLTKFLKEQDHRKPAFKKAVEKAMEELSELVQDEDLVKMIGVSPIAPVELVHICLLCLLLSGRSRFVQAKAISDMRAYVRKEHVDVRANNRVAKTFATYLQTLRAPGIPGPEADWQHDNRPAPKNRKRKGVDEDEEMVAASEEEPGHGKSTRGRGRGKGKAKAK
ncbi:hypothetical protein BDV93DRAFT_519081 [Ceratobasidium sp. AG-I]|nr:hypothetical protein BDV93DRAFT_519081 [Ceratobasidium sp. AG-I]